MPLPAKPTLVAVLGHKNSEGGLSKTAQLRCNEAAAILMNREASIVITTGAFGKDFNNTPRAHGFILEGEIQINLGAEKHRAQFLGTTPTFNTVHDLYAVRRASEDHNCESIIIVTSEFHRHRVEEIAKRVMPEKRFEIRAAQDGEEITRDEKDDETRKLSEFLRDWVAVPSYHRDKEFPAAFFRELREEHKHYDTLSLTIATGALAVTFSHQAHLFGMTEQSGGTSFFMASIIGFLFFKIYLRCAQFALISRRVMETLEVAWDQPGFSFNFRSFGPRFGAFRGRGVKFILGLIMCVGILSNSWFTALTQLNLMERWTMLPLQIVLFFLTAEEAEIWRGIRLLCTRKLESAAL